ncbi:MAG TPA: FliH/SctL family protein [Armatimonadota bacterium]|nr:FliH/SctL family protein [Armatimonadota bacterium]HPP73934.1 FliH/SctL family protein [Armatimonadota bacterium]
MNRVIKKTSLLNFDPEQQYIVDPPQRSLADVQDCQDLVQSPEEIAAQIIEQAKIEAESLVQAASDEAESIRSAAYREGYEEGLRQLDAEHEVLKNKFVELEHDAARQLDQFWSLMEPQLLKLAVDIAQKIVRSRIDDSDGFVLTTIKEGLRQLRDRQDLKIRVNPEDYQLVREHKEEIMSSCDGIRAVEVIEDRRVDKGGCLIESGNGHLDARIDTQLKEVERALTEAVKYGKSPVPAES